MEKVVHALTSSTHGKSKTGTDPIKVNAGKDAEANVNMGFEGDYKQVDPELAVPSVATVEELAKTKEVCNVSNDKPAVYENEYTLEKLPEESDNVTKTNAEGSEGFAKGVVLLFALTLDNIMGGMTVGLQDDAIGVYNLMVAILSHEFIIGFTLGLQLLSHNSKSRVLCLSIFYGMTCPFGIIIGTLILEVFTGEGVSQLIPGICMALTGGVFIYCTFFEILAEEISSKIPLRNILAIGLGFSMLAVLAVLVPHGH